MPDFQIPYSSELHSRLVSAPPKARAKYLRRIERMLQELSPDREYPFDYVRYRVIGYCIDQDTGESFGAADLIADLKALATEICPLARKDQLANDEPEEGQSLQSSPDLEPEPAYHYELEFQDPATEKAVLRDGGAAARESHAGLLSAEKEACLFRCYNYCKFKVTRLTRMVADSVDRFSVVEEINFYKSIALKCRNRILESNLGLVRRAALLHTGKSLTYEELISEGNNSLMRAVENFDYRRGNRFSTYATWVIVKNYAHSIPQENRILKTFLTESEGIIEKTEQNERKYKTRRLPRLWRMIEEAIEKLPEKERIAVTHSFGVEGAPISLREIAPKLGLRSKEIARQYRDRGLRRLQDILDSELYEEIYS